MSNTKIQAQHVVFVIIVAAALLRLAPHPDNVAPIGALALFSGAYLQRQVLWLVPLGALLLGDAARGFYLPVVMLFVYLGFVASTAVGRAVIHGRDSWSRIAAATVLGAVAFWTVSNIGNWWAFRPHTLGALLACYVEGLPYLLRSLAGDAVYVVVLFGGFRLLRGLPWVGAASPA